MSVHNRLPFLASGIRSLLARTVADFELVIGEVASTDEAAAVLERFAAADQLVRLARREHKCGVAGSLIWIVAPPEGHHPGRSLQS